MKISMCTAVYGKTNLEKIIFRSAELGFDAVELTTAFHIPIGTSLERRKEIKGWIRSAGINCSGLHYIFDGSVRLSSTDEQNMRKCTEYLCKVINIASDLEAKTVIVGSGGKARYIDSNQNRNETIKCMADVIRISGEHALKKGVVLAIEAINRYETNFINTIKEAVEFTALVDHPNVMTMADTYHMNIEEVCPADEIRKYGYTLANLHLADSNRFAPGEGHFDFTSVAKALKEINFPQYCSFEVFGLYPWKLWFDTFEEADGQMKRGIKFVRSIFDYN